MKNGKIMDRAARSRRLIIGLVTAVLVIAVFASGIFLLKRPTVLRAAVGPVAGEDARLMTAIAQILVREGSSVRLKIIPVQNYTEAAASVESGRADLAVLRSDIAIPTVAQTVAILHRNSTVFMTPVGSGIKAVTDLAGKRIGLLRSGPSNEKLLDSILAYYDVRPESVARVALQPGDVAAAIRENAVDCVLAIGPATGLLVAEAVATIAGITGAPPVFLPILEANALSQRRMALEPVEILRGAYGGTPPTPDVMVPTVSVSHRLAAHSDLGEAVVTELTRHIFEDKADLVETAPLAAYIEAPDTDKGARFVVHPGAAAYLDGEELSFIEAYGEWFYIVAMVLGVSASGLAALMSRWRSQTDDAADRFELLLSYMRQARGANTLEELAEIESAADELFSRVMALAATDSLHSNQLTAISLALGEVRHAISERRNHIGGPSRASLYTPNPQASARL